MQQQGTDSTTAHHVYVCTCPSAGAIDGEMEDIAADDDLLSDMLLDSLEFEPKIATHKMNQTYRSPRYKTQTIIDVVRYKVVIDGDLNGALEALCNVDVIKKHLSGKSSRQRHDFQQHARRYLETYMPDSGVEFALTTRYKRSARRFLLPMPTAAAVASAIPALPTTSMADLCVVATKPFKAGDLILMCKGGVKDLTKSEDEALREEAAQGRELRKEQQYAGVLGAGRDFSVIRSARKGCSQLLLGPARFVNHDCDPNCEFHRVGQSHMLFRCLRNIGLNEEITTYYGDNYFETDNAECMCHSCERRGAGVFAALAASSTSTGTNGLDTEEGASTSSTSADAQPSASRRVSARKARSPPPSPKAPIPTQVRIERNGKLIEKTFKHHVSQREFDPDIPSAGPQCTCLTCGSSFWAPEAWWLPDECRRCERHFKIFQSDWPARVPTEPKWNAIYRSRRAQRDEAEAQRKASLSASTSDTDTPVKMSPLRDPDDIQHVVHKRLLAKSHNGHARKIRRIEDLSDEEPRKTRKVNSSSDMEVEEALQGSRHRAALSAADEDEDDEELSDLTTDSSSRSESPASDTPKMLGKHGKTETLAMYWGAPSSDKRPRKQRIGNGLESLSDTVRGKKHRRTASDMSNLSSLRAGVKDRSSSSGSFFVATIPQPSGERSVSASADRPPPIPEQEWKANQPVLATIGPERTSVKNLAMAWGAGVADDGSGRGGRRRTPRDSSKNESPASNSPMQVSAVEEIGTPPKSNQSSPKPSSSAATPGSTFVPPANAEPAPPPMHPHSHSAPPPAVKSRSASPCTAPVPAPSAHHVSPLAGTTPSPVAFAARPGIVPGQPIRKNLRWGKGKVSISRPITITGNSPLAGPATFPPTTPVPSAPLDKVEVKSEPNSFADGPSLLLPTTGAAPIIKSDPSPPPAAVPRAAGPSQPST